MRRSDFHFELPKELIAQQPLARRSDSRLLHVSRQGGAVSDGFFRDVAAMFNDRDLLVFNDTRVIPARLFGRKQSGGKVEVLLERLIGEFEMIAQLRASKSPKPGSDIILEDGSSIRVTGRDGSFYRLSCLENPAADVFHRHGHVPLPPYIERPDEAADLDRYQTVYARTPGAVAAPTAGLHFDPPLLQALDDSGVGRAWVTLHVGAGTFQPVRADTLDAHVMHSEWLEVPSETCAAVENTRAAGGRVIAVGTTVVRSLETAAVNGALRPHRGESSLFIYPGYQFRIVDGLITNFHLPESTLLMLVCAFAGHSSVLAAYHHAIEERYRFFSYGDAMLVL